jgi:hypothetical protein
VITGDCCIVCKSTCRRLHTFTNEKARKEQFRKHYQAILGHKIDDSTILSLRICHICAKKCEEFTTFQNTVKERYNNKFRTKRLAKTPPSTIRNKISYQNTQLPQKSDQTSSAVKTRRKLLPVLDDHQYSTGRITQVIHLVECVDYILKTEVILSPSFPLDHL